MRLLLALFLSLTLTLFAVPATAQTSTHRPQAPRASASADEPGVSLILNECEVDQCPGRRSLWVFEGNKGRALWGWGPTASVTIASYANGNIVIDRFSEPDFRAHYVGTVTGKHIEGTFTLVGKKAPPGSWSADIEPVVCPSGQVCPLTSDQIVALGVDAVGDGLSSVAFDCFVEAASQGNADGLGSLAGLMRDTKTGDPAKAFHLAQTSARDGSWVGMNVLGQMYMNGYGTSKDERLGITWSAEARTQKEKMEKDEAEATAQERERSGSVVGLSKSLMDPPMSYGDYVECLKRQPRYYCDQRVQESHGQTSIIPF